MQHASRYLLAIELRMHWPPIHGWRNLCAKRQERSIRGGFQSQPMTGHTSTSKGAGFREPTTQWDCSSLLSPPGCTRRSRQLPAVYHPFFSLPVVCAGLLFGLECQTVDSPSAALGANMLGAVAGGLMENLSLVIGMRALLLVAMGLYCLAGIGLWRRWRPAAFVESGAGNRHARVVQSVSDY